jgi:serine protease
MTIPVGAPPGDWTFSIVALDEAINTVSLGTAELSAAQLPTRFTVISTNPDKLPPTLVALNFPTDVDVSAGPDTLVVAARLTDAGSGVSRFDFSMIAPNGVSTAGCSAFAPTAPGNPADGVWQCALVLPAGAPPGPWSIKAAAVDASFNTTFILPPDKITVVNTAPDPTPPELVSLTITPQTVDVSYGAQVVTVSARLTDAQSGVAGFTFRATARDSTQVECSATSPDTGGGTTADGTWSCRFTIPAGVARGDWLASVAISDKALNQRQYDTAAIGAKGLPTKFTVVSTTAP